MGITTDRTPPRPTWRDELDYRTHNEDMGHLDRELDEERTDPLLAGGRPFTDEEGFLVPRRTRRKAI